MTWIISKLLAYAWPIAAAAGVALLLALGAQTLRLASVKTDLANEQRARAQDRADAETAARIASENYRREEAAAAARVETAEGKYDALQQNHTATLAAHRAVDNQLRNQLAAYASGSGATSNTCTAERERAQSLGVLLADGVRLQEELARDAEAANDAVRALLEAWPE